ncbi:hypothetical protein ACFQDE_02385 [Deinococcus caeni]
MTDPHPTLLQLSLLGGASFRDVTDLLGGLTWAEASAPTPACRAPWPT